MTQQDKIDTKSLHKLTQIGIDRINLILGELTLVGIELTTLPAEQQAEVLTGINQLIGQGFPVDQAITSFISNTRSTPEKQKGQELGEIINQQADLISDQLSDQLSSLIWEKTWLKTWEKLLVIPTTKNPASNFLSGVDAIKSNETILSLTGVGCGNN